MEFFRIVKSNTTESQIQNELSLSNLDKISNEIFNLEEVMDSKSSIGGLWGEFTLERQVIKGGIRFSLVECPNALTWTITTGYMPEPESLIIHLTINRVEISNDFTEEINEFLDDMASMLVSYNT